MDQLFQNFVSGKTGDKSTDYYYSFNNRGAKIYYSKITGKRVAKNYIPAKFLNQIQERDVGLDIGHLMNLKHGYQLEIEKLQAKIAEIDAKLSQANIGDETTLRHYQEQKKRQDEEDERRRMEYEKENDEILRKMFERFQSSYFNSSSNSNSSSNNNSSSTNSKSSTSHNNNSSSTHRNKGDILSELNIENAREWRQYLLKHHPDKGGDVEMCQKVIAAGKARGW